MPESEGPLALSSGSSASFLHLGSGQACLADGRLPMLFRYQRSRHCGGPNIRARLKRERLKKPNLLGSSRGWGGGRKLMESETCETQELVTWNVWAWRAEGRFAGNLRRAVLYEAIQAVWFCFVFTPELSLEAGAFCPGT